MTARAGILAAVVLAACCPDPTGNRGHFKAGPVTTASYAISAVRECPAIDQGLIAAGRGFSGSIAVTRLGLARGQTVSADWLRVSLLPSLRAAGLRIVEAGVGSPCDPATWAPDDGGVGRDEVAYVMVDNWYDVDAVLRQINLQLAIDQLGGEVDLVIQPINALCQAGRGTFST